MDDILKLKEMLDVDTFAPVAKQLQQKAWLLHWSLFVFFNHESGLNALIDLFMQDRCELFYFMCFTHPALGGGFWAGGWPGDRGSHEQTIDLFMQERCVHFLLNAAPDYPTLPPPTITPSFSSFKPTLNHTQQVPDRHPADLPAPAALPGGGGGDQQAAAQRAQRPEASGDPGDVRVQVRASTSNYT